MASPLVACQPRMKPRNNRQAESTNAAPGRCRGARLPMNQAKVWLNTNGPMMVATLPRLVMAPCKRPCSPGSTWRVMMDCVVGPPSPAKASSGMPSRNSHWLVAKPKVRNPPMPNSSAASITRRSPKTGTTRRTSTACTSALHTPTRANA